MRDPMTVRGRQILPLALVAILAATLAASAARAATVDSARAAGIQLDLSDGWSKVAVAAEAKTDPRTLLVIGTDGVRPIQTDCQVASYRIPADGAAVVVIGWKDSLGIGFPPLSAMKLRRGTFECFDGRGAFARVSRGGRDFQVNVLVGDKATAATVDGALDAARSLALVSRS
jgi:hypothetical protein